MLLKMSEYVKCFDATKYMSFLIKNEDNRIWDKVSNFMKKGFDSEPVYDETYLKTKIKSYDDKINTNFDKNVVPKKGFHCVCLSVVLIDRVLGW